MFNLLPTSAGAEPLRQAVLACRTHLIGAAVFSALVNLLYLTPTLYMLQVYDRVVPTGGLTTLVLISAVALFALAALAALDWLRVRILLRTGLKLDQALTSRILARTVDLRGAAPNVHVLREFDHVRTALSGQGTLAVLDAPWTPIFLMCCFLLHWSIGFLTLFGGLVLFLLAWLNERDTRERIRHAADSASAAYAAQESLAAQAEVVRALGMRANSIARQADERRRAVQQQADANMAGGRYTGAIKFVRLTLQSAALGLAGFLVIRGQMTPGAIIASSVLLSRAVAPIEQLVGAWPGLVKAHAGWRRLIELFDATADVDRPRTALPAPKGQLAVESVSVRLTEAGQLQLKGANLTLEPGQTLGVIGSSGSGKTTLARVIAGALIPTTGAVRLDGAEYSAWDSDALARHIGYLPQTPSLFAGSVRDNISRFAAATGAPPDEIDRAVVEAAQAAGAHDMIQRLSKGYDTELGAFGAGLSAGQAQRVALARALYGDPVLLVLDEPNSNLDQDGESALMNAILAAARRGAAVVIVAHRAGVLSRVDNLLVLKDGAIQTQGPREEVLARLRSARAPTQGAASR
ncbi:type I secretion system permease/ATPase [Brevundimonas sp. BAL450]|uniref:type I secretion system permease/ATPase n=1 Tax=Brevundimonas TaxID=41275 RepID=UPI000697D514|nr:type I secretion system permease/ATPase [Brevundimonas abyssalis]MBG7614216.1 type I secretion system permease/ATPase [Brevundimonas sp. BAL450]